MADTPIVSIADLSVTYAGAEGPALRNVDLEVRAGESVGIIGLNGAGKTTLGLTLNGVIPQLLPGEVTGRVLVGGRDATTVPVREMARTVGIVFDNPEYQLSQPTVADEVALGLENLGVAPGEMPERIATALAAVGLSGVEERSPITLSAGQQQRLAIAAVLAMEPRLLFLDEPTSNLDPAGAAAVVEIVRRLSRQAGMTVIVAEHDVEALAALVDRMVVLDGGRVVREGSPSEVFSRVAELAAAGLRVPQVTEFAAAIEPGGSELPVTVEAAIDWLEARA